MPVVSVKTDKNTTHTFASKSIAVCDQIAKRESTKPEVIEVKINNKIVYKK